jgi:hypothetical protein
MCLLFLPDDIVTITDRWRYSSDGLDMQVISHVTQSHWLLTTIFQTLSTVTDFWYVTGDDNRHAALTCTYFHLWQTPTMRHSVKNQFPSCLFFSWPFPLVPTRPFLPLRIYYVPRKLYVRQRICKCTVYCVLLTDSEGCVRVCMYVCMCVWVCNIYQPACSITME